MQEEDYAGWTFQLRYIRCGKWNCRTCNEDDGHGPYWYGYQHRNGKVRSKYFGRRPTSTVTQVTQEPRIDPRWEFHGRMDWRTAMRIMGFTVKPNAATLQARWRALITEHHPDRGGDTKIAAAINVAYHYLKG